jgi:hypothetical protein
MSLHVPSSLLLQAGENQEAQRFLLASTEWIDLQTRVQAMLALPSDLGEFEERYGDASGCQMKQCFHAMHKLQQTASRYGSPKALRAHILNDSRFLADAARPRNDALAATVWTLEHAHEDAQALAEAFRSIPALARAGDVAAIKSRLLGEGRIIDRMHLTIDQLNVLIGEFQAIESELDAAQLAMTAFTERASRTRACLDKEIGALQAAVVALERARESAYQKWLALTLSACIVPGSIAIAGAMLMVTLALPAGASSFAIGPAAAGARTAASAASLAHSAAAARAAYDTLLADLQAEGDLFTTQVCFRTDLGALDQLMKFSLPDSSGVIGDLVALKHGWTGAIRELSARANELSAANLHAAPWLDEQALEQAAASWRLLDSAIRAFVAGAFLDAEAIDFGSVLPRDDGAWQTHFSFRKAA